VKTKTIRVVKNTDNDALLPCGNRKFVVGKVDELNGVIVLTIFTSTSNKQRK